MVLSMLAIPATATNEWSGTATINGSDGGTYTLTNATTLSGTITGGAYIVNVANCKLTASNITVSGGSLKVNNGSYSTDSSTVVLDGTVALAGGDFAYSVSSSTYVVRSSTFTVTRSGYTLSGWSVSDDYAYPTWTSNSSSSGTTTTTTTSSDTTVKTSTTVSGSTATVSVTTSALTAAVTAASSSADKTVTIDVSSSGSAVTTATIKTETLSTVSDASGVSLTVAMPDGEITLDDGALAAIVAESGTNVSVTLDVSSDTASLAEAQQEKLAGLATGATISASITSDGKTISTFGGGSVTLSVPFKAPADNRPAEKFGVYYVPAEGKMTRQPTTYANGKLSFTTPHFSDFVAVYEPFADVTANLWYAQYALAMADKGIMTGTDKGFEGDLKLDRATMVTTLFRIKGAAGGDPAAFTDVRADWWYTDAINWAAANGVAQGTGGKTFAPAKAMTREEMAQFLYNYAKMNGEDMTVTGDLSQFSDAGSVSDWAKTAMIWAVTRGYISGQDTLGNGTLTLAPQGTASRAVVATVLARFAGA